MSVIPSWALLLLFAGKDAAPEAGQAPPGSPLMAQILEDLARSGAGIGQKPATIDGLRETLEEAEDALAAGDAAMATTRLYAVVESPRFAPFAYAREYQAAEFQLGRALARGGASGSARTYLMRVVKRGPKAPFFAAAFRAMVDIALESRDHAGVWTTLADLRFDTGLPRDAENELSYLRGKVDYERGELGPAESWFGAVTRESRFYASSLYFRGLVRARQGQWRLARDAFCEIVGTGDKDRFSFYIDGRYFALKDLAFLALGRISHEQDRYDDAYYFYFQVPEDSERLPEALFEAAWTMFQKHEHDAARAFLDQFDRLFPKSSMQADAAILRAHLDLRSCRFDKARRDLEAFVGTYAPVLHAVRKSVERPEVRADLYRRLLARDRIGDRGDRLLELMKVDPNFYRFEGYVRALEREQAAADRAAETWARLAIGAGARAPADPAAAMVVKDIEGLVVEAAGAEGIESRARLLLSLAREVASGGGNPRYFDEALRARALGARAAELRAKLIEARSALGDQALSELGARLDNLLRQARLGQIDAVIGKKKRLEAEIANLYDGRFPADIFHKLEVEGLIGDDEEYWPYEGEYWKDEYENYK